MLAPLLALLSAASWGVADFAGGITTRLSSNIVAVLVAQGVGLVLAAVLLVASAEPMPAGESLAWAAAAGVSGTLGLFFFYLALSRGTMGLVAPLTALAGGCHPGARRACRRRRRQCPRLVGMVAALAAVVLISLPDRRLGSPVLPTYHGSRGREWLLILVRAWASPASSWPWTRPTQPAPRSGGRSSSSRWRAWPASASACSCCCRWVGCRPCGWARAALLTGTLGGSADFAGNLFFVLASQQGDLSVVVVLSSLYPIGTALLARTFLHERLGPLRMAGVGLAVAGVMLIGLGAL